MTLAPSVQNLDAYLTNSSLALGLSGTFSPRLLAMISRRRRFFRRSDHSIRPAMAATTMMTLRPIAAFVPAGSPTFFAESTERTVLVAVASLVVGVNDEGSDFELSVAVGITAVAKVVAPTTGATPAAVGGSAVEPSALNWVVGSVDEVAEVPAAASPVAAASLGAASQVLAVPAAVLSCAAAGAAAAAAAPAVPAPATEVSVVACVVVSVAGAPVHCPVVPSAVPDQVVPPAAVPAAVVPSAAATGAVAPDAPVPSDVAAPVPAPVPAADAAVSPVVPAAVPAVAAVPVPAPLPAHCPVPAREVSADH
ncbi:uncharacterized protein BP01DRAFT_120312 [Aspergillus saccharolyticus JOP 1030-1]|uniref:Uncharacterized protein n=1 Tax=Aspergillus saccharolyticus JOP 1030-1 TaxID=1450539 RepID=A0A318ZN95_9EURO|nr:hypothetical protein BP01DRAFT_120312 [Aspergillus saccharolyticus JOP 1030-1]PYH49069.1 hypothetical protein BP01DRAFT_120312 [Aspergillus saccharolyticus JOP 1030-1]